MEITVRSCNLCTSSDLMYYCFVSFSLSSSYLSYLFVFDWEQLFGSTVKRSLNDSDTKQTRKKTQKRTKQRKT